VARFRKYVLHEYAIAYGNCSRPCCLFPAVVRCAMARDVRELSFVRERYEWFYQRATVGLVRFAIARRSRAGSVGQKQIRQIRARELALE